VDDEQVLVDFGFIPIFSRTSKIDVIIICRILVSGEEELSIAPSWHVHRSSVSNGQLPMGKNHRLSQVDASAVTDSILYNSFGSFFFTLLEHNKSTSTAANFW
jgi:hypothetical protein